MDAAIRKRLYNLCHPGEPLAPGDPRYARVGSARGGSFLDRLADRVALSSQPLIERVTAVSGAGLTTELLRLGALLEARDRFVVVPVDASAALDLHSPIDVLDLVLAALDAAATEIERRAGAAVDRPLALRVRDAVCDAETYRQRPDMRARVRREVEARRSRFFADVHDDLALLDYRAKDLGARGLVIVVDSMPRLGGTLESWPSLVASAERMSAELGDVDWPVPLVCSLPPALVLRSPSPIHVLPALRARDDAERRDARDLVSRRVPEDVLGEGLRDALIDRSGGIPKLIVAGLRELLVEQRIDAASIHKIMTLAAEPMILGLPLTAFPILDRVVTRGEMVVEGDGERALAERLVTSGAILRYHDGAGVHPVVLDRLAAWKAREGS